MVRVTVLYADNTEVEIPIAKEFNIHEIQNTIRIAKENQEDLELYDENDNIAIIPAPFLIEGIKLLRVEEVGSG